MIWIQSIVFQHPNLADETGSLLFFPLLFVTQLICLAQHPFPSFLPHASALPLHFVTSLSRGSSKGLCNFSPDKIHLFTFLLILSQATPLA